MARSLMAIERTYNASASPCRPCPRSSTARLFAHAATSGWLAPSTFSRMSSTCARQGHMLGHARCVPDNTHFQALLIDPARLKRCIVVYYLSLGNHLVPALSMHYFISHLSNALCAPPHNVKGPLRNNLMGTNFLLLCAAA